MNTFFVTIAGAERRPEASEAAVAAAAAPSGPPPAVRLGRRPSRALTLRDLQADQDPAIWHRIISGLHVDDSEAAVAGAGEFAPRLETVSVRQISGDRIAQQGLFFGIRKIHQSPKTAWAMMLRWISFDPA